MTASSRQSFDTLPGELPIFPLASVLLLPRGHLPLNIFEPRYIAMVDEALSTARLIGMVQPREDGSLYSVGCAGRVQSYHETQDGRYEIVLMGVCRFKIDNELAQKNGFRRAGVQWHGFEKDMQALTCLDIDRARLKKLLKNYFKQHNMSCSWEAVDNAPDEKLMTSLAMICPFEAKEKQALLEAPCCKERAKLFMDLLEIESCGGCGCRH